MPASKVGHDTTVAWPRDVTVSVARDEKTKTPNTYCMSMMLRPALTEALKDAAQHVSRVGTLEEDFTCAFAHVVTCSRFDVKSHEGHLSGVGLERHGRRRIPALQGKSLTNRFNLQISYRLAWCKGHHVGRGNRYSVMICVPKVEVEGPSARLTCCLHAKGDRRANRSFNGMSCGAECAETEVEVVSTTHRTTGVVDQKSAVYRDAADTNPQIVVSSCGQPLTRYSNSNIKFKIMNPWLGFTAEELNMQTLALRHSSHRELRSFFVC